MKADTPELRRHASFAPVTNWKLALVSVLCWSCANSAAPPSEAPPQPAPEQPAEQPAPSPGASGEPDPAVGAPPQPATAPAACQTFTTCDIKTACAGDKLCIKLKACPEPICASEATACTLECGAGTTCGLQKSLPYQLSCNR